MYLVTLHGFYGDMLHGVIHLYLCSVVIDVRLAAARILSLSCLRFFASVTFDCEFDRYAPPKVYFYINY